MKILLLLIILSFSISSHSQIDLIGKKKTKSQIGVIYAYENGTKLLGGGRLSGNSYGVNWTKRIKNKFRFDVGLQFTKNQTIIKYLTFASSIDPQSGIINSYKLINDNSFLDVPVKINFFILQKKSVNIYLITGIYSSFYL